MTIAKTICVPPDLASDVIAKCSETVLKGLATAPGVSISELLDDIVAKRAQLWLVLDGKDPLATAVTEIIHDGDKRYVAVFGLGGRDMWKWSRSFAETMVNYAKAEGCDRVRFAGSEAWGRVVPDCHKIGMMHGQAVFERAAND